MYVSSQIKHSALIASSNCNRAVILSSVLASAIPVALVAACAAAAAAADALTEKFPFGFVVRTSLGSFNDSVASVLVLHQLQLTR